MKRVLVTGGAGFIGSHLVDALLKDQHHVICVDNLFTGREANIAQHKSNPNFRFVKHDVIEPISLEADQVFHLACPASPVHYQSNPVRTVKTNVMGTINMLGLAKRTRAEYLLASTSEVYGDPQVHPQVESYWGNVNPIGPRSCYDEGKRVAETLTYCYHSEHKVKATIVRIFNTYGPRMLFNDGRVVSNFIVQALRGESLTIYGQGEQTRSFCFVSDMVAGLRAAMNKADFFGPVNLGNPRELTVGELAKMVVDMTGSKSKIIHQPLPKDDPTRRKPNISKAEKELSWSPKITLEAGLKLTIQDFDERLRKGETNG